MNRRGNDTAGFPQTLTAETLRSFITTERGCTHPRVGEINGRRYIAKCGIWSAYSNDEHVSNELAADTFLREAGRPATGRTTVQWRCASWIRTSAKAGTT